MAVLRPDCRSWTKGQRIRRFGGSDYDRLHPNRIVIPVFFFRWSDAEVKGAVGVRDVRFRRSEAHQVPL